MLLIDRRQQWRYQQLVELFHSSRTHREHAVGYASMVLLMLHLEGERASLPQMRTCQLNVVRMLVWR
jgi:hypothetical protein